MTTAEPRPRYVLYRKLAGGEIESYAARAPTGDPVLVHLVTGASDRGRRLLEGLDRLPGPARERVRTVESVDGAPVVVTDRLDEFESLPAWLDDWLAGPPTSSEAPTAPPPSTASEHEAPSPPAGAGDSEPGEFTRLFLLGELEGGSGLGEADGELPQGERPDAGQGPPEGDRGGPPDDGPGEFTKLFLLSQGSSAVAPTAPERAGERTVPEPPSVPEPTFAPEPRGAAEPPSAEAPSAPEPPSAAEPPADDGPGEFTRLFGGGGSGGEAPDSGPGWGEALGGGPVLEEGEDYLERLGAPAPPADDPEEIPPPAVEPVPEPPSGPSRYTRILRGGDSDPTEAPEWDPPPPSSGADAGGSRDPETGAPPPRRRPYVIALVVIVVLTIGVIVAFALLGRGAGPDAAGEAPEGGEAPAAQEAPAGDAAVTPPEGGG